MPRRDEYDDDDYDDEPRRRPPHDPTGGLIPLRNGPALAGYYCGVFGLIPCFGFPLSIAALTLGIVGRAGYRKKPEIGGLAHAWAGIVLGGLQLLGYFTLVTVGVIGGLLG